ncbi:ATP-dependent endonuclease family protein [Comamonas testosteroni ATCC 11996]|nr:ATP-dependent endonuclease family protein [Comamonas testosteroni ATCC 11996]
MEVEALSVDANSIDIDSLLPMAGITFRINDQESGLERLGTGHQSSVILSLYRQLGVATGKFVLYLFEEPDNHLHPTSLRAIADELKECVTDDSQAVITTHSPYFMNQFPVDDWFPLVADSQRSTTLRLRRLTKTDRELRVAFGKYGLRPPEALLSKRVVVVEGANDVTLLRELIEIQTDRSPDRQDLLIIPAGGKEVVSDLCLLLEELGASWLGVMDWDATEDTRQPMLKKSLPLASITATTNALDTIQLQLMQHGAKKSKAQKFIDSLRGELAQTTVPFNASFSESVLGRHLGKARVLNQTDMAKLVSDVARKRMRAVRESLTPAKLWVWSGIPESVLVNTVAAELIVDQKLQQHGVLSAPAQVANRKSTLINALHGLGHKPEVLQDVIRALHAAGELRNREWRELVTRAIS